jgi:hypothetical protein
MAEFYKEEKYKESKSGICGPAGYNGKAPSSLAAPVKKYPGSSKLANSGGDVIEGPADDASYNAKE